VGGSPATGGAGMPSGVTVQLDKKHQIIDGFGLGSAWSTTAPPWETLFGTTGGGLGLSIMRVAMRPDGVLSGMRPPTSYNAKLIGFALSAPADCKDNNNTQKGGHLQPRCYDSWATTLATFAKQQGLYAMGVASEPDFASCGSTIGPPCNGDFDSMVFTAKEMVAFINVLGPKLKDANVKLLGPEPAEWLHLWSNLSASGSVIPSHPNSSDPLSCGCFRGALSEVCASTCDDGNGYDYGHWLAKDPTAWAFIDIIGTHEFDTQVAEPWPSDVDGGKRTKQIWQTEMSGIMHWPEQGPSSDISNGVAVAGWIHSALVVGEASAWLYAGFQPLGSNDNEGLALQGSTILTKRAYTLGNYSKFVRPGYVMVEVAGNSNGSLLLSAYSGTDAGADSTIIVAVNKGTTDATLPISISGGGATPTSCMPYVTSATDNLAPRTNLPVMSAAFNATLPSNSVTTFVCK
jgi:glucuronoarabinoxylan endo-1,4-beta-xylanase